MYCSKKKMSSCLMNNQESDEEVDLEALRLAALKSRKTKYGPRVNHNNLIPIVPVAIENSEFLKTKIKKEKVSPMPERKLTDEVKVDHVNQEYEEEKGSNYSESSFGNDQDILSVDDKEEEDSLERLMDQLEAEISGKVSIPSNRIVVSSKSSCEKKDKRKKSRKTKKDGDDEVELVQIKSGKEPGAIVDIRESASPVQLSKDEATNNSGFAPQSKSPPWRSRSKLKSRSPCYRSRSYRRSRSPYWLKRSRSPFRRSSSPFWRARRSRSSSRKSRSPVRRYRSPIRKRSPFSRFSKSRSRSIDRRSPWSLSPRRRSKSPYYRDGVTTPRRKNFDSPSGRLRRSFSPREGSKSPRRRSRSPRRSFRSSPNFRSKSPFNRSRSVFRRTPPRRSQSPFMRHSKSPNNVSKSPYSRRSPGGRSKTPNRWSASPGRRQKFSEQVSPKSSSPSKKNEAIRRSPNRIVPKDERSLGCSTSPTFRRNRSPLRAVEKNKIDANDKIERANDRIRNEKRHRSLSGENNKNSNRRPYRQKPFRRFSPLKNRTSAERQIKKSKSPKQKDTLDRKKEEVLNQNVKEGETNPNSAGPPDPILEARKKKFENLKEIDPTKDKKISLKAIKESTENFEDDEDALTINIESNLWDESEESGDEFESRFKSGDARKNRTVIPGRTVLSFRSLREGDSANRKVILNKPLIEDNRLDRLGRGERQDRWKGKRNDRTEIRKRSYDDGLKNRSEEVSRNKKVSDKGDSHNLKPERRSERKPIVWSNKPSSKSEAGRKVIEETAVQNDVKEGRSSKKLKDCKDRLGKEEGVVTETDDFDKLISDFEKELESDICLSVKEVNSTVLMNQSEMKRRSISVKKDLFEPKINVPEIAVKKPASVRRVKISEANSRRIDSSIDLEEADTLLPEPNADIDVLQQDGPEDYIEDDDFVLDVTDRRKPKNKLEDDDVQSDLRAILSRRRNERLTKTVSLQENMPTRLVQSAFQGLGNTKSKRQVREVQEPVELIFERNIKNAGGEGRRVLLVQRERNPSSSDKNTVPEVKPDSTIYQRLSRSSEKRKRNLQRHLDSMDNLDQEEEEEGLEMEEEKQSRRFRLKRNVKLSSQVQN